MPKKISSLDLVFFFLVVVVVATTNFLSNLSWSKVSLLNYKEKGYGINAGRTATSFTISKKKNHFRAKCFSGLTFIRYVGSQNIGCPNYNCYIVQNPNY